MNYPFAAAGFFTQALNSYFGAEMQAQAFRAQRAFQAQVQEMNNRLTEYKVQETVKAGESQALKILGLGKKVKGQQRVSFAAQGLDVDFGVARDIQAETEEVANIDATTIRNNAWRQAWGYRMENARMNLQGAMNLSASRMQETATLLGGQNTALAYGLQGVGSLYDQYGKKG